MATIVLHFAGPPEQKHSVRVTPMTRLRDVLADTAAKFRPRPDPALCQVTANKKPLDLDTPFRLLNIPSGARLDLVPVPPSAPSTAPEPRAPAEPRQQQGEAGQAPAAEAPATAPPTGTGSGPQPAEASCATSQGEALAALGITRPLLVFTQRAVEEAAAQLPRPGGADDPDDAFFDLTPTDFARIMAANEAKKKQAAGFRTRTARDSDAAAAAASYGPVRVRLHLPDGTLLQSVFAATDSVGDVAAFAAAALRPPASDGLYLYTAPPKSVLKQADATLAAAGLVPAAHVYLGLHPCTAEQHEGPLLRPEVAALLQEALPPEALPQPPPGAEAAAENGEGGADGGEGEAQRPSAAGKAAYSRSAGASSTGTAASGGERKVPKWMKL